MSFRVTNPRPAAYDDGALAVIAALIVAIAIALRAWGVMLLIGILSANGVVGGTVSFWTAVPIAILTSLVITPVSTKRSTS